MFTRNKLLKILISIILILNSSINIQQISSSLTDTSVIPSYGQIFYDSLGIHVVGNQIIDSKGNAIILKGFSIYSCDIKKSWPMEIYLEGMQQIKDWGFNVINIPCFWGRDIEPDEYKPGIYDETNLLKIENMIQLANQVGLYVILSMRVHHATEYNQQPPWWWGWPIAQMLEDDPTVRQRYLNMWTMMIQRFDKNPNLIGYNWWFFPWHEPPWNSRIAEEVEFYYDEFVPDLLAVTRDETNKIIFFTPYKQGAIYPIDSAEYYFIEPIDDSNVVYCLGWHQPYIVEWVDQIEYDAYGNRIPWDYNIDALKNQIQFAVNFKNKYNVPMMITEMGLHTYNYPDVQAGTFYQDRIDCYDAKLSLLNEESFHWIYWLYSNQPDTHSGVLKEGTMEPFQIVDVLRYYAQ